jgi:hypothetical protein
MMWLNNSHNKKKRFFFTNKLSSCSFNQCDTNCSFVRSSSTSSWIEEDPEHTRVRWRERSEKILIAFFLFLLIHEDKWWKPDCLHPPLFQRVKRKRTRWFFFSFNFQSIRCDGTWEESGNDFPFNGITINWFHWDYTFCFHVLVFFCGFEFWYYNKNKK